MRVVALRAGEPWGRSIWAKGVAGEGHMHRTRLGHLRRRSTMCRETHVTLRHGQGRKSKMAEAGRHLQEGRGNQGCPWAE